VAPIIGHAGRSARGGERGAPRPAPGRGRLPPGQCRHRRRPPHPVEARSPSWMA